MKSKTRLDSAIFQLTPTRTRCDLYIIANKEKEKIASGLLNPFLAHLKTAQDQIAKGGYSVLLEPQPDSNATWFTKFTVESFVRFVSTPEILERVYTIETEILQIEEAISIQGNNDIEQMEDHQVKSVASGGGNKPISDANAEKAIVLYKPDAQPTDSTGPEAQEGNSKVQLLKVLETRKTVLQKEQGMAFARAVAAGFETDHVANLLSFAECFGASRLMNACLRFMDLWKQKHDSGQWLEIEAVNALSSRSDFSSINASGNALSSMTSRQSRSEVATEVNEKTGSDSNAGHQEHSPGQYPHPVYPPWAMHSSPGAVPVYQAYPTQGMPYYQPYPPPYPSMEDPRFNGCNRTGQKRHSLDNRDGTPEAESQNGTESENEESSHRHKKAGKSTKKQPGMVVIRNINYITSKRQNSTGDDSESASDSDSDIDEIGCDIQKSSLRSSKRKAHQKIPGNEENMLKEADGDHWQAFQSYLLKGADEDSPSAKEGMFAMEKDPQMRRRMKAMADDPLAHGGRDVEMHDNRKSEFQKDGENFSRVKRASYNDDFITNGREQANQRNLSDPLSENGFEGVTSNLGRNGNHGIGDETFIGSLRSMSLDQDVNDNRTALSMGYELPSRVKNTGNKSNGSHNQVNYEPNDLSLMPERGLERQSVGYDPALDYEMQLAKDAASLEKKSKEALTDVKQRSKSAEKDQKKKKISGPMRKGKPSKTSPLEDARARAEKLRSFKADLQKMKKEQQDADRKRLEALKIERQKRVAARTNSISGQSTLPTRKPLSTRLSPMSHRGSKFSDSEPGSSSPLQRSKIRTTSLGSSDPKKPSTSSRPIDGSHLAGNRMTRSASSLSMARSASSLSETKKESNFVTPDSKASMARIRRLSEPKKLSTHTTTVAKITNAEPASKLNFSKGLERKKVSAILNLDRSKAATLPELKIKTPKGSSNESQKNLDIKETRVKGKEDKQTVISEAAKLNINSDSLSHQSDVDDKPVIEKTVVTLEHDQPSISVPAIKEYHGNYGTGENIEAGYAAIDEVPLSMDVVDKAPISIQSQKHPNSYEMTKSSVKDELVEDPSMNVASKPYQAPYARVSSLEDPSTRNSDYGKAPQTYVSDFNNLKLEKIPEVVERPQAKEPKGFRRLLKFGKKSQSPEPDDSTLNTPASSEVHTLKNLIFQDETPTAGTTSQKSSRHFSLLAPFRSKTSEKHLTP